MCSQEGGDPRIWEGWEEEKGKGASPMKKAIRAIIRAIKPWDEVGKSMARPANWWGEAVAMMVQDDRGLGGKAMGERKMMRMVEGVMREVYARMMGETYERVWLRRCRRQVEKERREGMRRIWRMMKRGEQPVPEDTIAPEGNSGEDGRPGMRMSMLPPADDGMPIHVSSFPELTRRSRWWREKGSNG
ncbi:hypothetical protein BJ684DRAFT_17957 [Piptocephalis cylindrospora]|uniref:Uncharacterized protein n=1 Tax=Piptocephalis cylindrospora TaxID=1907219 RepID=A0A4P9XYK5_9FUNG|nr:hypothetical protein BJ684DRAFT_17957 [Piptocephalis cylindrospora]|eukprot:RKP11454.1 hypothetical protein BJ684DRAFT_17957 [Piptocephalis cylindrospora]